MRHVRAGVIVGLLLPLAVSDALGASASTLAGTAPAQPISVSLDELMVQPAAETIGSVGGAWSVGRQGGFAYSIGLDVPDGRGGVSPALGLNYNSDTAVGLVGVGWKLSGFSTIARCKRNPAQDATAAGIGYVADDKYCLDGQKLVLVSGTAGAADAVYRTLHDHNIKVVLEAVDAQLGPKRFKAYLPNGRVQVYETVLSSQRTGYRYSRIGLGSGEAVALTTANVAWLLSSETDALGNAMTYEYTTWARAGIIGSDRLNELEYVPSKISYSNVGGSDRRRVEFEYEELSGLGGTVSAPNAVASSTWVDGTRWVVTRRLKAVRMFAPNPAATAQVWRYELAYNDDRTDPTHSSRLGGVRKCGSFGGCTWWKHFDWDVESVPLSFGVANAYTAMATPVTVPFVMNPNETVVADFNGDGADDLYVEGGTYTEGSGDSMYAPSRLLYSRVTLTDGRASSVQPLDVRHTPVLRPAGRHDSGLFTIPGLRTLDVNQDGQVEFFADRGDTGVPKYTLLRRASLPDTSDYTPVTDAAGAEIAYSTDDQVLVADMNGDARPDLLVGKRQDTQLFMRDCTGNCSPTMTGAILATAGRGMTRPIFAWSVRLMTASGYGPEQPTGLQGFCPLSIADGDGDGRAEVYTAEGVVSWDHVIASENQWWKARLKCDVESTHKRLVLTPAGALSVTEDPTGDYYVYPKSGSTLSDITGDGLPDLFVGGLNLRANTGAGYYGSVVSIDGTPLTGFKFIDQNGDGLSDIVWHRPGQSPCLALSRGEPHGISTENCHSLAGMGTGLPIQTGDFNGDGMMDLLTVETLSSQTRLQVYLRTAPLGARLIRVREANEVAPAGTRYPGVVSVTYARPTFEKGYRPNVSTPTPLKAGEERCGYPLICMSGGQVVVATVTDTTNTPEPGTQNSAPTRERRFVYGYEDPLLDVSGNGFLGFGAMTVWDHAAATHTRREYALRRKLALPGGAQVLPSVDCAATEVVTTALITDDVYPASAPGQRVTTTRQCSHKLRNGSRTFEAVVDKVVVKEESGGTVQPVTDWASGTLSVSGMTLDRQQESTYVYDSYGATTSVDSQVVAPTTGARITTSTTRKHLASPWTIGLPDVVTVTAYEVDGSSRSRVIDHDYDAKGRLDRVRVNPDATNVLERRNVRYYYDDTTGVLRGIGRIGQRNLTDASIEVIERFDYPVVLGEPDEQIYATQRWMQDGTAANGYVSHWQGMHPAFATPVASLNANGELSRTRIDELGRPDRVMQSGQADVVLSYETRRWTGNVVAGVTVLTQQGDTTIAVESNLAGLPVLRQIAGFSGETVTQQTYYDVLGRAQRVIEPGAARYTDYDYDVLGRVLRADRPGAGEERCSYTFAMSECTDESNQVRRRYFDINGRLRRVAEVTDHELGSDYAYYPLDGLRQVTDPNGHITSFDYDAQGLRKRVVSPDAGTTDFTYDGLGSLWKVERPDVGGTLRTETLVYDAIGRIKTRTSADGTYSYTYDSGTHGKGRLAAVSSPWNIQTAFRYSTDGMLAGTDTTVDASVYSVDRQYDSQGRLSHLLYPTVDGKRLDIERGYNSYGYLSALRDVTAGRPTAALWSVNGRDARGLLSSGQLGDAVSGSIAADGQIVYGHDYEPQTGLLNGITVQHAGASRVNLGYTYFANGQLDTRSESNITRSETYTYDGAGRLATWNLTNAGVSNASVYQYADDGNLLSVETPTRRETNLYADIRPHAVSGYKIETRACCGGAWGAPTTRSYSYDARGRRTSLPVGSGTISYTFFDLPTSANGTSFRYDGFGNRVVKSSPSSTSVTIGGLFERRTGGGEERNIHHVNTGDGPRVDVIMARSGAGAYSTSVEYVIADRLGNSVAVLDGTSAGFGTVLQRLYYEPFGRRIQANGANLSATALNTANIRSGFTGHEHDDELGVINAKGRLYDPYTRRFLTPDPYARMGESQSWASYTYVRNDPVNLADPTGYMELEDCRAWDDHTCSGGGGTEGGSPGGPVDEGGGNDSVWEENCSGCNDMRPADQSGPAAANNDGSGGGGAGPAAPKAVDKAPQAPTAAATRTSAPAPTVPSKYAAIRQGSAWDSRLRLVQQIPLLGLLYLEEQPDTPEYKEKRSDQGLITYTILAIQLLDGVPNGRRMLNPKSPHKAPAPETRAHTFANLGGKLDVEIGVIRIKDGFADVIHTGMEGPDGKFWSHSELALAWGNAVAGEVRLGYAIEGGKVVFQGSSLYTHPKMSDIPLLKSAVAGTPLGNRPAVAEVTVDGVLTIIPLN